MKKPEKANKTVHLVTCKECGSNLKVYCQLKKGGYSQVPLECPQCGFLTGLLTSSPGYELERLVILVLQEVSGY